MRDSMTVLYDHGSIPHSSLLISATNCLRLVVAFCIVAAMLPGCAAQEIRLSADARQDGVPLVHFWSKVVGAGRANEGLRATWQEELRMAHHDAGFQYVRFHGLFHDDMFVYREDTGGKPVYNFQYIDDVFDRILAQGVRPFVEFVFVPAELATVKDTTFWWHANGSPPTDNARWAALVDHTLRHWVERYGLPEMRTWYFEVWNEPNLPSFFRGGTQAQYFELYKLTAETIKAVDPQLRVGGPATSNFNLDEPGTQTRQHLRRSIDSTRDDLRTLREIVNHSAYPNAEIQLTEWNSSPSPTDHAHDSLAAAAFVVKTNLESIGLVDSLSYWTFTDVFEENRKTDEIFHGGFGLINYQQIPKAAFHGYRMMNQLGDRAIAQTVGGIVTRSAKANRVAALVYNYPPEVRVSLSVSKTLAEADAIDATGSPRELNLHIDHLPPAATFEVETLDREHGNAISAWEKMGRPDPPTRAQTDALRKAAWGTQRELVHADGHGVLEVKRPVAPWSLVLITQQP